MKKFSVLIFLFSIISIFGFDIEMHQSIASQGYINGFIHNPAFLASEEDFGFFYQMDYDEDREQLFAFRAPKSFGFARDFQETYTMISGAYPVLSDLYMGISYFDSAKKGNAFNFGAIYRPTTFLSLGYRIDDFMKKRPEMALGIAVRPFGDWLTFYAQQEYIYPDSEDIYKSKTYYGGVQVSPINGLSLEASYDDLEFFRLSFTMQFSHFFGGGTNLGNSDYLSEESRQYIGYSFYDNEPIRKVKTKVIELELSGDYTERGLQKHSFEKDRFYELIKELASIEQQASVRRMLLKIYPFEASLAQLQEIRDWIVKFREKGEIICYAEDFDLKTYYLASVSNQIIVPGGSEITLNDFVQQQRFYQLFLQNQGVEINTYKMGEFEGSSELLSQQRFSDAVMENREEMYNEITDFMIAEIAKSRASTSKRIRESLEKAPMTAYDALQYKLVDAIGFEDEARHYLLDFSKVRKSRFKSFPPGKQKKNNWKQEEQIAVVYLQGSLFKGESFQSFLPHPVLGDEFTGVIDFKRSLDKSLNDENVKAIVVRIDSGGGQIGAIEKVWNMIFEANRKKPILISISGNATGGAYYIATGSALIFAEETSLVGGIGVSAYHWNWDETFASKGIQTFNPERSFYNYSNFNSNEMKLKEKERFNDMTKQYYKQFLAKVSSARGQSIENIDFIGRGKIFSGISAKKYGLVDELGGLHDCIIKAKQIVKLPNNAPVVFVRNSFWKQKWNSLNKKSYDQLLKRHFYYHSGINTGL